MPNPVPGQFLAHMKARRFGAIAKLCAPGVDFQAWTPVGHWVAHDGATVAQIVEVWLTPAGPVKVLHSEETVGPRGTATLEFELAWHRQANWGVPMRGRPSGPVPAPVAQDTDPLVMLRLLCLLTTRDGRITRARIYGPGLRNDAPLVDLQRQFRAAGISSTVPTPATL